MTANTTRAELERLADEAKSAIARATESLSPIMGRPTVYMELCQWVAITKYLSTLATEHAALLSRVEAAEKDAGRYRWLRTCKADNNGTPFIARYEGGYISQWTIEPADTAIDAAIAATKERDDVG